VVSARTILKAQQLFKPLSKAVETSSIPWKFNDEHIFS
jgi:hypothetical protein